MKRLEEVIGKVESIINEIEVEKKQFYEDAIKIHEDKRLREFASLVTNGFEIIKHNRNSIELDFYYTGNGLTAYIPTYYSSDDWGDGGYCREYEPFRLEKGKLVAEYKSKYTELLELFPSVTIEQIVDSIESGIKSLEIYKRKERRIK